jgi:hypothetical protein
VPAPLPGGTAPGIAARTRPLRPAEVHTRKTGGGRNGTHPSTAAATHEQLLRRDFKRRPGAFQEKTATLSGFPRNKRDFFACMSCGLLVASSSGSLSPRLRDGSQARSGRLHEIESRLAPLPRCDRSAFDAPGWRCRRALDSGELRRLRGAGPGVRPDFSRAPGTARPRGHVPGGLPPAAQQYKPCTGPLCSGRPVPPPVAPPTLPVQEWPCTVSAPTFTPAHDFAYLLEEPVRVPAFHGDSVFHPPR